MVQRFLAIAASVMSVFLLSINAVAIYSWVDEKGVTHISDYPQPTPERPEGQMTREAEKEKENVTPAASERIVKPAQSQLPAESVQPPSAVAAPVPVPAQKEQSSAPSSFPQTRFDGASSPTMTPTALPTQPGVEASSNAPQIPAVANTQGTAMHHGDVKQMIHAFISMFLFFLIAGYLYFSLCLYFIARKLNISNPWLAWVPIFQIITLLESASQPAWWALLFFVPLVNVIVQIYVWMCISENLGRGKWAGLLMLVPLVNLVFLGMLAFSGQDGRNEPGVVAA